MDHPNWVTPSAQVQIVSNPRRISIHFSNNQALTMVIPNHITRGGRG